MIRFLVITLLCVSHLCAQSLTLTTNSATVNGDLFVGATNVAGALAGKQASGSYATSGANANITSATGFTGAIGTPTAITLNSGSIAASAPSVDMAQTWNNSGVAFTGLRINVINTASSSASLPIDYQLAGSSQFSVRRDGLARASGGFFTLSDAIFLNQTGLTLGTTTAGFTLPKTITAVGTTGAQTINKISGRVNFAAGATALTVTDSTVTANSVIVATAATNDTTGRVANVVAAAGSFTINVVAPTAEMAVNFIVFN